MYILCVLYIHLGGDKTISRDAMNEFFYNLSMQALSKSDKIISLKFDATNRLTKNINSLLVSEALAFENAKTKKLQSLLFDLPTVVGDEPAIKNKTECTIVKEVLKDKKPPSDVDDSDILIVNTAEETEQENIIQNNLFLETELRKGQKRF